MEAAGIIFGLILIGMVSMLVLWVISLIIHDQGIIFRRVIRRNSGTSYVLDWERRKRSIIIRTFHKGQGGGYRLSLYRGERGFHFFHIELKGYAVTEQ